MKTALRQLLDDLDEAAEAHEEVGDTDVREAMSRAVLHLLLVPKADYVLPDQFRMYTDEGDRLVKHALARFFAHPEARALATSNATPTERLAAFQDESLQSAKGSYYDDYFGFAREDYFGPMG
jgi:hypothetical protein